MDNTYKVWNVRRWLRDDEIVLCPNGQVMFYDKGRDEYLIDKLLEVKICHAVGLKDKNGIRLYANDIICSHSGTLYIIRYERCLASWQAWDFKAWAKGYYDAYIPLHEVGCIVSEDCEPPCTPEPKFDDVLKVGTVSENPELCPEIFDKEETKS